MRLRWLLVAGVSLSLPITVYLLRLGATGNQIAGTLALPLAVAQTAIALWKPVEDRRRRRRAGENIRTDWAKWLRWVAIAGAVLSILASIGAVAEIITNNADIQVTNDIRVSMADRIANGESAIVDVPGTPPNRRYIRLLPVLSNPDTTGDCVAPATLTIRAVIDGANRGAIEGVSGRPLDISLANAAHTASVAIEVHQADPMCVVDLRIESATLHN